VDNGWKTALVEQASALEVPLDAGQIDALAAHVDLLLKWNAKLNLTRITGPDEVRVKHVLDSLGALRAVPAGVQSVLDIGAGAGFPGIPWRIARPNLQPTLVDAVAKKVGFLKSALAQLRLSGRAVHVRLEGRPALEGLQPVDLVVSRAFSALPEFLALARAYLRSGGQVVAMLGPRDGEPEAREAAARAGFELVQFEGFALPESMGQRAVARFVPRETRIAG